jgi:hypothetical protein
VDSIIKGVAMKTGEKGKLLWCLQRHSRGGFGDFGKLIIEKINQWIDCPVFGIG